MDFVYEQRDMFRACSGEIKDMALRKDGDTTKLVSDEVAEEWAGNGGDLLYALREALTSGATCSVRLTARGELGVTLFHREKRERFVIETPQDIAELGPEVAAFIERAEQSGNKTKSGKR
jgi:hypothetical protein